MIPTIGDDARLRDILLAAKRSRNFGKGNVAEQIVHVEPLIRALDSALSQRRDVQDLVHQLLGTVREVPIYDVNKPEMGSEPLAFRWVVAKPGEFDKVVMRLRAMFPEVLS